MAMPSGKLAGSLALLRSLQERGVVAVRTADLPRSHRERLVRHGFLLPVMKGWYVAGSPGRPAGDSTAWYASFWRFCAGYLGARFGEACACRRSSRWRSTPIIGPFRGRFSSARRGGATASPTFSTEPPCWKSGLRCLPQPMRWSGRDARGPARRRAGRLPGPVLPRAPGRCAGCARPGARRLRPAAPPPRRRPRHGRRPPVVSQFDFWKALTRERRPSMP